MAPKKAPATPGGVSRSKNGVAEGGFRIGRAGRTHQATQWAREEFGFNAELFGGMTPDQCRGYALQAQGLKQQLEMAQIAARYIEEATRYKVQIEHLRAEILTASLDRKAQIDKLVQGLEIKVAQHEGHIAQMVQTTQYGVQLAQAKTKSTLELGQSKFRLDLQSIAQKFATRIQEQQTTAQLRQGEQQQAQIANQQRRSFVDFLHGKGSQSQVSAGAMGNWFS